MIPSGPDDSPLWSIDLGDARSSINQRQLRRQGLAGWQAATTAGLLAAWELTTRPGVFFDVGANAGVYSLLCRVLWPTIRPIAFEPTPQTVAAGQRWAAANGVDIHFEQLAVSDQDGQAVLHLADRTDASHSLVEGFRDSSATLEVPVSTLDSYVARAQVAPTVTKIDVEQHELAVLRGAGRTLAQHRPVVVMEVLRTTQSRQAHQHLQSLGYESRQLGTRDCIYWPEQVPTEWDTRFPRWLHAVSRCVPRRAAPPQRPAAP